MRKNYSLGRKIVNLYGDKISSYLGEGEVHRKLIGALEEVLIEQRLLSNQEAYKKTLNKPLDYNTFPQMPKPLLSRIKRHLEYNGIATYHDLLRLLKRSTNKEKGVDVRCLGKKCKKLLIQHLQEQGLYPRE
jgi:hypothetical protein